MTRELLDLELDTVAGGFDLGFVRQSIVAPQVAVANANGSARGFGAVGIGGTATAFNIGGTNANVSNIG